MAEFHFLIKQKVTLWEHQDYIVEAEDLNAAKERMLQIIDGEFTEAPEFTEAEFEVNTQEDLVPDENQGRSTTLLLFGNNSLETDETLIWKNGN